MLRNYFIVNSVPKKSNKKKNFKKNVNSKYCKFSKMWFHLHIWDACHSLLDGYWIDRRIASRSPLDSYPLWKIIFVFRTKIPGRRTCQLMSEVVRPVNTTCGQRKRGQMSAHTDQFPFIPGIRKRCTLAIGTNCWPLFIYIYIYIYIGV